MSQELDLLIKYADLSEINIYSASFIGANLCEALMPDGSRSKQGC